MKVTIEKGELVVRIPVQDPPRPSKSGKTLIVASSGGGMKTSAEMHGKQVTVNVSAWTARS